MIRRCLPFAAILCLPACATLPAPEAKAFHELATANRDAFGSLVETQTEVFTRLARRGIESGRGRIQQMNCSDADLEECRLSYDLDGADIALGPTAVNTRKLIDAIATYGERMAQLAEASDLEAVSERADAAAGAVQALIATVSPPAGAIAKPILEGAALAHRQKLVKRRRAFLLQIASAAKPSIDTASMAMTEIAKVVRDNLAIAAARSLREGQRALNEGERRESALVGRSAALASKAGAEERRDYVEDRLDRVREQRGEQVEAMVGAARALNATKQLEVDFKPLADAHDALIAKLRNPDESLEAAIADIDKFLALLDSFAAVTKI
jgi:hypothetical protein